MTQETKSNVLVAASSHPSWRRAIGPRPTTTAQKGFSAKRASIIECCGLLVEFTNGCIIAMPNQKPSIQKQTHLVENINKGEIPFVNKTELEAGKRVIFVCALDPNSITCKTSHTATQVEEATASDDINSQAREEGNDHQTLNMPNAAMCFN
jgi:hypothetical protein